MKDRRPAPSGAVIRPAATVVVVRPGDRLEILLVKRSKTLAFMPDLWVFPGGRVDDGDEAKAHDQGQDAFRVAALRETYEEVALTLQGGHDALVEFACWVTPPNEKRRYHTRFFVGSVEAAAEVIPDASEIVDFCWLHPASALAEHRAGRLPLAPPTWWVLFEMQALLSAQDLAAWAHAKTQLGHTPIEPTFQAERGRPTVRWGQSNALSLMEVDGVMFWEPVGEPLEHL